MGRPRPARGDGVRRRRGRGGRELVAGHDLHPGRAAPGRPTGRGARRRPDDGLGHPVRRPAHPRGAPRRADRVSSARIDVLTDRDRYPGLGVPTRLAVRTDAGEVRVDVPASGRVEVPLPGGATRTWPSRCSRPTAATPGEVLTGLVAVDLDGVRATEAVVAPDDRADPADAVVLSGGLPGSDGCVQPEEAVVCFGEGGRDAEGGAVLSRRFTAAGGGRLEAGGTLDVSRWATDPPGLATPGVAVTASSSRTAAPAARPEAVVDGDERTAWSPAADDTSPTLTLTLDEPADVQGVTLAPGAAGWRATAPSSRCGSTTGSRWCGRRPTAGSRSGGRDVSTVSMRCCRSSVAAAAAAAALEVEEVDSGRPRAARPRGAGDPAVRRGPGARGRRHHGAHPARRSALGALGRGRPAVDGVRTRGAGPRAHPRRRRARRRGVAPGHRRAAGRARSRRRRADAARRARQSPTHLTGTVAAGPQRLLALTMNHNAGWEATLDGAELTPVVVDGFRQGYVVPRGPPARSRCGSHRTALPVGPRRGAAARAAPARGPARARPARASCRPVDPDAVLRPVVVAAVTLGGALLVAGPWAALAAAVALAALRLRRRRRCPR